METISHPLKITTQKDHCLIKSYTGKVLTFIRYSRDPETPNLFQIVNVDSAEIRWIHGEEVTEIVGEYRTGHLLAAEDVHSQTSHEGLPLRVHAMLAGQF